MYGYKNAETYHCALWCHNDEFVNNIALPDIFIACDNNPVRAGEALERWFRDIDILSRLFGCREKAINIRLEIGSLNRVEWPELFNGL